MSDTPNTAPQSTSNTAGEAGNAPLGAVAGIDPAAKAPIRPAKRAEAPGAPKPGPAGQPSQGGQGGRLPNGQFATRDTAAPAAGAEGTPEEAAAKADAEAKAEARRIRGKAKIFGEEEEFDYSEEDIPRVHQRLRMLERKEAEFRKGRAELEQEAEKFYRLAKENPEAFLREAGHDLHTLARKRLAEQARLASMDEHERAVYERDQKIAHLESQQKQQAEAEKEFRRKALREHINKRQETMFLGALKTAGLPASPDSLRLVLETYNSMMEDFGPEHAAQFSPEELAHETTRRLDEYTDRFLGTLDGATLRRKLGPKRVKAIIEAELADYQSSQPYEKPAAPAVDEAPETDDGEYIDEAEAKRRLRTFGR